MDRTKTSHLDTHGRETVSFSFPPAPSAPDTAPPPVSIPADRTTTLRIAPGSEWTTGSHYHPAHTEYLLVLQGTAEITLSGETFFASAPASDSGSAPAERWITVPRGAVHSWRRHPTLDAGTELVVLEWTDPDDGLKEVFFRNLLGITGDGPGAIGDTWVAKRVPDTLKLLVQVWLIMEELDNIPVPWDGRLGKMLGRLWSKAAWWIGRGLGLKAAYKEYTPDWLMERADSLRQR